MKEREAKQDAQAVVRQAQVSFSLVHSGKKATDIPASVWESVQDTRKFNV